MVKTQVTKKAIMNEFNKVIEISYCRAQFLLQYHNAQYYTYSNMYGWRADIYVISDDIAIVTGYAPFGNIKPEYDIVKKYDDKAAAVYGTVSHYEDRREIINGYLNEFIKEIINND